MGQRRSGGGRTIHSGHDKADLCGIGSTREMGVYLFGLVLVQRNEAIQDIVACGGIVRSTFCNIRFLVFPPVGSTLVELAFIIREVVLHRAQGKFLLEPVDLIQKQNDGCFDEPPRVADGIEQGKRLLHAVDSLVLEEKLIVLGDGDKEKNGGHIFEAVNPFLSFRPLATYVKHSVRQFPDDESGFSDSGCLDTRA